MVMEEEKISQVAKYSVGIVKMLLITLKRRVSLAFLCCVSKVDQFNCCKNSVMLSRTFL